MMNSRLNFIKTISLAASGLIVGSELTGSVSKFQKELSSLLTDEEGKIIGSVRKWKQRRIEIFERWSNFLGFLEANPATPEIRILEEERNDGVIRQYIEYEGERGDFVKAYLLKPEKINNKLPGVVALHSTSDNKMLFLSGKEKGKILPMGFRLAQQGFVVICPVCFLWHNRVNKNYNEHVASFQSKHPGSTGMAKMLFDASRAVDVLVSLKEVDKNRIGTMGHSLGAKEALYLGAFDDRIKVIVSNEGGIGISFSNWDDPWYLGKGIHNFGHDHHELLALCAPKPFFLIGGESEDGQKSIPYVKAASQVYDLYGKAEDIQFYNHYQGHSIAPEAERRTYAWMIRYL